MKDPKITSIPIEEEMKSSYLDYAMSVIVGRALPDVRDGLKPVHRRILYAMYEMGLLHDKAYKKSASVVGEVLGKYHPHGDMAVYDALVRMAQDFSMRYPLIDGQGNFGSIDGDAAAAYRYTEARLSKIAEELLKDIDKDTVDFGPNFDGKLKEPLVLPSGFPNLLVNGSSGIAVGMATNIPPHNLNEVIDAIVYIVDHPDATLDDIMNFIKGPDFPTGGIILGIDSIKNAYETGSGNIVVEAKYVIEEGKRGKDNIIIQEIPYQVNKSALISEIAELVRDGKIEGISDIRDESNRDGIRIVLELKQGAQEKVIINKLLKHTKLRTGFGIILLALVDGVPMKLSLIEILKHYIQHRRTIIERRSRFLLKKAQDRAHIIEGLKIAIDNIDEIVKIIKNSKDTNTAKKALMERFKLTEIQSQAILDMKLSKLTGLERKELEEEYKELIKKIEKLKSILSSSKLLDALLKEELLKIKEEFGDERKTKIMKKGPEEFDEIDLIVEEDVVVLTTHKGWIKRMPVSVYRAQKKGGRGILGIEQGEDDFVKKIFVASTHDRMLIFTNRGNCYGLNVYDIPEGSRVSRGRAIVNLVKRKEDEKINAIVFEKDITTANIVLVTKSGVIKKVKGENFKNAGRNGIIAINLKENDELIDAEIIREKEDILLSTRNGMVIRFCEDELREMGRQATGVIGARLKKDDHIVSVMIKRDEPNVLFVTENGIGKKTPIDEIRKISRGGKGVIGIKLNEKTGKLAGAITIGDKDEIIIITKSGIVLRLKGEEIKLLHRSSSGVKIIRLQEGDSVADITKITPDE